MKVVHLSTVHPRNDARIYYKECRTLNNSGFSVSLIVADGNGYDSVDGISIFDIGRPTSRLNRMTVFPKRIFFKALEIGADIFHLHDPELIPIGLKLKRLGKTVIFDAHEDYPKQILAKQYLGKVSRKLLSLGFSGFEKAFAKKFDFIVAATPKIREKYNFYGARCIDVNNYPVIRDYNTGLTEARKSKELCYVGGLSRERGIFELISASKYIKEGYRLSICGRFFDNRFEQDCKAAPEWARINYNGYLERDKVFSLLQRSILGIVTLHPTPNYIESQPIKLFEYMLAGIPVVASDFPDWKEIVIRNSCGLSVNPLNPIEIGGAINNLINDPLLARKMGENGRMAVFAKFNWENEEKKLLKIYEMVLANRSYIPRDLKISLR